MRWPRPRRMRSRAACHCSAARAPRHMPAGTGCARNSRSRWNSRDAGQARRDDAQLHPRSADVGRGLRIKGRWPQAVGGDGGALRFPIICGITWRGMPPPRIIRDRVIHCPVQRGLLGNSVRLPDSAMVVRRRHIAVGFPSCSGLTGAPADTHSGAHRQKLIYGGQIEVSLCAHAREKTPAARVGSRGLFYRCSTAMRSPIPPSRRSPTARTPAGSQLQS